MGDISFIETFGRLPDGSTNERLRIETHIHYIEGRLRAADVSHLSPQMQARRLAHLDRLHTYHIESDFPVNDAHPDKRRPTFMDNAGRLCAVSALVGRETAAKLAKDNKYSYLRDMPPGPIDRWAADNGFSVAELATIQPGYERPSIPQVELACSEGSLETQGLGVEALEHWRSEVEVLVRAHSGSWGDCVVRNGIETVDLDITSQGVAARVRRGNKEAQSCLRRVFEDVVFPVSCGAPLRVVRVHFGSALPTVTWLKTPSNMKRREYPHALISTTAPFIYAPDELARFKKDHGETARPKISTVSQTFDALGNLTYRVFRTVDGISSSGQPLKKRIEYERFLYDRFRLKQSIYEDTDPSSNLFREVCQYEYEGDAVLNWSRRVCRVTWEAECPQIWWHPDRIYQHRVTTREYDDEGVLTREVETRRAASQRPGELVPRNLDTRMPGAVVRTYLRSPQGEVELSTTSMDGREEDPAMSIFSEGHPHDACL